MRSSYLLAVNCGSSSVKIALFDRALKRFGEAEASRLNTRESVQIRYSGFGTLEEEALSPGTTHAEAIGRIADAMVEVHGDQVAGIGHRVVHGGPNFSRPMRINADLMRRMNELSSLAPLHQPHNLDGIRLLTRKFPRIPEIACFDTGFHRSIPERRQRYGLPDIYANRGLRAYGFHGLSCTHVCDRFTEITGDPLPERLVIAHLGNGASVTGAENGRSRYNSMGFTPIDGLIMGQRSGHLDPGAVLWLVDDMKGNTADVAALLNRRSGLLGISGESSDMRTLLASKTAGAKLAIAMFVDRVCHEIAAAAAAIEGIDALVFTGGIGSGSAQIRAEVLKKLDWMGFALDSRANRAQRTRLTGKQSAKRAYRIVADEEQVICRAVLGFLKP